MKTKTKTCRYCRALRGGVVDDWTSNLISFDEKTKLLTSVQKYCLTGELSLEDPLFSLQLRAGTRDSDLVNCFVDVLQKLGCGPPRSNALYPIEEIKTLFPSFQGTVKELVYLLVDKIKRCVLDKRLKKHVTDVNDMIKRSSKNPDKPLVDLAQKNWRDVFYAVYDLINILPKDSEENFNLKTSKILTFKLKKQQLLNATAPEKEILKRDEEIDEIITELLPYTETLVQKRMELIELSGVVDQQRRRKNYAKYNQELHSKFPENENPTDEDVSKVYNAYKHKKWVKNALLGIGAVGAAGLIYSLPKHRRRR